MRTQRPQKMKSHHQLALDFSDKSTLWSMSFNPPVRVNKARIRSVNSSKFKKFLKTTYIYFLMFLETSSIHGLNHLISKKRDISER
jgi:hypothetical protein